MTTAKPLWGLPDPDTQPQFYADVPTKRFIAWIFDSILIALLTALIVPFTAFTALFFLPVLYLTVGFFYRAMALARHSATPGMRLMAIEFRSRDGRRFDPVTAMIHTFGYTVSVSMMLPQVVSVLLMMITPRAQGLTDHLLGTAAMNRTAGS